MKVSRAKTVSKGGACTRCGKHHPPGKKRRARMKAKGLWGGCVLPVHKEAAQAPKFDVDMRAAKNATTKERNEQRRERKRKEAEQRNAKWQSLTLEEQLAVCKASPYNKAKQIEKIKQRIRERDDNEHTRNSAQSGNDNLRRKHGKRPSRRSHKKGGRKVS